MNIGCVDGAGAALVGAGRAAAEAGGGDATGLGATTGGGDAACSKVGAGGAATGAATAGGALRRRRITNQASNSRRIAPPPARNSHGPSSPTGAGGSRTGVTGDGDDARQPGQNVVEQAILLAEPALQRIVSLVGMALADADTFALCTGIGHAQRHAHRKTDRQKGKQQQQTLDQDEGPRSKWGHSVTESGAAKL